MRRRVEYHVQGEEHCLRQLEIEKNDVAIQYKRNCGSNYLRNNASQRITVTAALLQVPVLHIAALQVSECPHLQQLTKKRDCER